MLVPVFLGTMPTSATALEGFGYSPSLCRDLCQSSKTRASRYLLTPPSM